MMSKKTGFIASFVFAVTASQGSSLDCQTQRNQLSRQAFEISKPKGFAASIGVTPLLYLAFVEGGAGGERIKSIEDLAKAIRMIKPSLGSVDTIRDAIVRSIRTHWEDVVRKAVTANPDITDYRLLQVFTREIESALPRSGYSRLVMGENAIFSFSAQDTVFEYHFHVSGEGAQRTIKLSVLRDPTNTFTRNPHSEAMFRFSNYPWDDFIQRYFSKPGLLQFHARNVKTEARALGYDLISYLKRGHLVDLSDDEILRFIARGDSALLEVLRQAVRGGSPEALAEALRSAGRRSLMRGGEGWLILGGIALGVGVVIAWVQGESDLEKYVRYFADRFSGTTADPVDRDAITEAFQIEDRNTLVEIIRTMGCSSTNALWNAVFASEDYPIH